MEHRVENIIINVDEVNITKKDKLFVQAVTSVVADYFRHSKNGKESLGNIFTDFLFGVIAIRMKEGDKRKNNN